MIPHSHAMYLERGHHCSVGDILKWEISLRCPPSAILCTAVAPSFPGNVRIAQDTGGPMALFEKWSVTWCTQIFFFKFFKALHPA